MTPTGSNRLGYERGQINYLSFMNDKTNVDAQAREPDTKAHKLFKLPHDTNSETYITNT